MKLTARQVLYGYSIGIFPMADEGNNFEISWYEPERRGILPLNGFHISHSLKQTLRSKKFHVTINRNFEQVIRSCSERKHKWISEEIIGVFCELHETGFAHSFEVRNIHGELVGGLYGVSMGKAFFGESMYSKERDASKVALAHLVAWLNAHGFELLDTQYVTDHLRSLGAVEISKKEYLKLLNNAIK